MTCLVGYSKNLPSALVSIQVVDRRGKDLRVDPQYTGFARGEQTCGFASRALQSPDSCHNVVHSSLLHGQPPNSTVQFQNPHKLPLLNYSFSGIKCDTHIAHNASLLREIICAYLNWKKRTIMNFKHSLCLKWYIKYTSVVMVIGLLFDIYPASNIFMN